MKIDYALLLLKPTGFTGRPCILCSLYHRMYFITGNHSMSVMQKPSVEISGCLMSQKQDVKKIKCL